MLRKLIWMFAFAATGMSAFAGANIQLKVGSVGVATNQLGQASCIQVPIFINDPQAPRNLRDVTITLEITGDTNLIDGSITQGMVVANGFTNSGGAGVQNPGSDLVDAGGTSTPTCSAIFNCATQVAVSKSFFLGNQNASWTINNNFGGVGRKQAFAFNAASGVIGASANTDQLILVLEIPLVANPGVGSLTITPVPNGVVADGNSYSYAGAGLIQENFDLSSGAGTVNIGKAKHTGLYRDSIGAFFLDINGDGFFNPADGDITRFIGMTGDLPVIGDWNNDGVDNIGIFRQSNQTFYLDLTGDGIFGPGDLQFGAGTNEDEPVAGTWMGSADDNIALWRPSSATFFFDTNGDNVINPAGGDRAFSIGSPTDTPIIGDWDGDGVDQVGLFRSSTTEYFLDMDDNGTINLATSDVRFLMGDGADLPTVGDWNNSGLDGIGLYRQSNQTWFLDLDSTNSINGALGDKIFVYGAGAGDVPISGIWQ